MAAACPDCSRPFTRDRPAVESITGRRICADCRDDTLAAAAGMLANPGNQVAGAIATQGWFRRLRANRRNSR